MGQWMVQRTNTTAATPRFEWLARRPTFDPGAAADPGDPAAVPPRAPTPEVLPSVSDVVWTSRRNDGTWRDGPPHDLGRRGAERWAGLVDGVDVLAVRIGDPDPEEVEDPVAATEARRREARIAYRAALAAGTEPL